MKNEKTNIILGFDIGTSGLKCIAYELDSGCTYSVYSEWKLLTTEEGFVEFDCDDLWNTIVQSIARLSLDHGISLNRIAAIGFCALCPGLIAIDANGKEISRCIIFMDSRSSEEANNINSVIPFEKSHPIVANRIMSGATSVTTMMWLKRHVPDAYQKTAKFLHLPSWAGYKLTGQIRMDLSNAAGTGLYDIHNQCWSVEMTKAAQLDMEKLPPLAEGVELLGGVNNSELIAMGIRPGTPVSCGAGDTVSALLALSISPHQAMLSLGTSHVLYAVVDRDRFDPMLLGRSFVFKDTWAIGGAMSNPGLMLRWFRDNFCQDIARSSKKSGCDAYNLINEDAARSIPGAGGLICLPYITGERSPVYDSNVRAVFLGVNLNTTRADFARSIMESSGLGIRQLLEILEKTMGETIESITVTGGGSQSKILLQIIADITGRTINVSRLPDVGAMGAALTGAIAAGLLHRDSLPKFDIEEKQVVPNLALGDIYNHCYDRYTKIYPSVKDLF